MFINEKCYKFIKLFQAHFNKWIQYKWNRYIKKNYKKLYSVSIELLGQEVSKNVIKFSLSQSPGRSVECK